MLIISQKPNLQSPPGATQSTQTHTRAAPQQFPRRPGASANQSLSGEGVYLERKQLNTKPLNIINTVTIT